MIRIHITGASGTGTTTLAAAVGARMKFPHFDADNYFWLPREPRYTCKRPVRERNELLLSDLTTHPAWVLSGSITGWGSDADRLFDATVYLWVPTELRIARLRQRELAAFGDEIAPGGSQYEGFVEFIDWAGRYDTAGLEQRSRAVHEAWLRDLQSPVIRLEGDLSTEERVARILEAFGLSATIP